MWDTAAGAGIIFGDRPAIGDVLDVTCDAEPVRKRCRQIDPAPRSQSFDNMYSVRLNWTIAGDGNAASSISVRSESLLFDRLTNALGKLGKEAVEGNISESQAILLDDRSCQVGAQYVDPSGAEAKAERVCAAFAKGKRD